MVWTTENFLKSLYLKCDEGEVRGSVVMFYRYANHILLTGNFSDANEFLARVDLTRLPLELWVSICRIFYPAQKHLTGWVPFRDRLHQKLIGCDFDTETGFIGIFD